MLKARLHAGLDDRQRADRQILVPRPEPVLRADLKPPKQQHSRDAG